MYNRRLIDKVKKLNFDNPVTQIASDLDISKGTVSSYLNGNIKASKNFLEKFANFYNIDKNEIIDTKAFITDSNTHAVNETEEIYNVEKIGVPFYDLDFTAGFLPLENNTQTKPDSYITHPFFKGCDYVVRASGQSMAKVISHGDAIGLIKVENWHEFFPFGEIYAIVTKDGFRMIKVITKGEAEDYFTLISKPTESKKEEFPPQQIKKSLILAIFKVQASSHLF